MSLFRPILATQVALSLLLASALAPAIAQAQGFNAGYGTGYYGGNTQVVMPDYSLLRAGKQYFPPTYRGVKELCLALPNLCQQADSQQALDKMGRNYRRAVGFQIGGSAAVVGGLGVTVVSLVQQHRFGHPMTLAGIGLVLGGAIVAAVGGALTPDRDDVRALVNEINRAHTDDPIQWSATFAPSHNGLVAGLAAAF